MCSFKVFSHIMNLPSVYLHVPNKNDINKWGCRFESARLYSIFCKLLLKALHLTSRACKSRLTTHVGSLRRTEFAFLSFSDLCYRVVSQFLRWYLQAVGCRCELSDILGVWKVAAIHRGRVTSRNIVTYTQTFCIHPACPLHPIFSFSLPLSLALSLPYSLISFFFFFFLPTYNYFLFLPHTKLSLSGLKESRRQVYVTFLVIAQWIARSQYQYNFFCVNFSHSFL